MAARPAGYNIIRAIGIRLSVITPSRGFCIELATAVVVATASIYGLPVSTTHCQVCGVTLLTGAKARVGASPCDVRPLRLGDWVVTQQDLRY